MAEHIPIYQQISSQIEEDILNGYYHAGDKVPSTNELAMTLAINPATAGKGLNALVDAGILFKKRGLGMFVTEEALAIIYAQKRDTFKKNTLPRFLKEAKQLQIEQTQLIQMIKEAYHVNTHADHEDRPSS